MACMEQQLPWNWSLNGHARFELFDEIYPGRDAYLLGYPL